MAMDLSGSNGVFTVFGASGRLIRSINGQAGEGAAVSGSGATVTFTVSTGAINAVTTTPAAGGTGYPASAKFILNVTGGGGTGGLVLATTNSSGVVTAFAATPVSAGSGYTGTTGAATTPYAIGWDGSLVRPVTDAQHGITAIIAAIGLSDFEDASVITTLSKFMSFLPNIQAAQTTNVRQLANLAGAVLLIADAVDQNILPSQVEDALGDLVDTMVGSGTLAAPQYSIKAPTVSVVASAGSGPSPTGNFTVASTIKNVFGQQQDYIIAETLTVSVTADRYDDGIAMNSEPLLVEAKQPTGDILHWSFPSFSGGSVSLTMIDATIDDLLLNGDFEDWTGSVPDSWLVLSGVWSGTPIDEATGSGNHYSNYIGGSISSPRHSCLKFTGDGSAFGGIYQLPTTALIENAMYFVSFYVKTTGTMTSGMNLEIAIADRGVPSGTVADVNIANDVGVDNSIVVNSTALNAATAWTAVSGWFQTPFDMSGMTPEIVVRNIGTAFTNLATVLVSDLSVIDATSCQSTPPSGPFICAFAGNVAAKKFNKKLNLGDYWNVVTSNNWKTGAVMALICNQMFNLGANGVQLPSTASPTVPESLVTAPAPA